VSPLFVWRLATLKIQAQSQAAKKAKPPSQKEQSERFIATARELESDESGNEFDAAIQKLLPFREKLDG
jgi:hypothetical protein